MNKKHLAYAIIPTLALTVLGAGFASAYGGWFGGCGNLSPEEIAQKQETILENKAEFFGISVEEMKDAWAEGKTPLEIAEEQGITQEELQEKMKESKQEHMQAQIQAMVDNGVITQEQADQRLQSMEDRLENGEGKMWKGFKGFRGGFSL